MACGETGVYGNPAARRGERMSIHSLMIHLDGIRDRIDDIDRGVKKPIGKGLVAARSIFKPEAIAEAPKWTGLLRSAHKYGPRTFVRKGKHGAEGTAIVWVDPSDTTQHKHWGGIPSVYGEAWAQRKYSWFDVAQQTTEPEIIDRINAIWEEYLRSF